ncbi:MAG: alpha/beta fold hydrolase, partial [Patescibacteria group bacterium]
MEPKIITLKTSDNIEIVGDYYAALAKNAPAAIFIHMIPTTRESWKIFAKKLNEEGFHCLAIDLRGHGDSRGGPNGFQNFSDENHQESINDIKSAVDYFVKKGIILEKLSLIGA